MLAVPCSTINNGAVAATGSLDPLVSNLDALNTQSFTTLSMDTMEVDSNGDSATDIRIDGQIFKLVYPPEPQPIGMLVLPGKQKDEGLLWSYPDWA
ncbi:hypothetical protein F5879DRAFT_1002332 [Lentinula edodes]|nr:hypothetical protein F5879DRAFT_1002332 [Lentinula edodes]